MPAPCINPMLTLILLPFIVFQTFFFAMSTDNTQLAELAHPPCSSVLAIVAQNCAGRFSTTTDGTVLCLELLFQNYDTPFIRNCKVECSFTRCSSSFLLSVYHTISRHPIQMKNDSHFDALFVPQVMSRACIVRQCCSNTFQS